MVDSAGGKGAAHNATVLTGASSDELQAELTRRADEYEANAGARLVSGLEESLAKHEAAVAHIKERLADAKAEAAKGTN